MADKTTLYTPDQRSEIQEGKKKGLNTTVYEDPAYLSVQMREIRLALEKGLDVSALRNPALDWLQMEEIRLGLESKIDVKSYADPEIPYQYMRQIRKGLEAGIDVTGFLTYPAPVVRQIRKARRDGVDIMKYVEEGYETDQLEQIRLSLVKKIDVDQFLSQNFSAPSIEEFRIGLEKGLDISVYAKPEYEWRQMRELRLGLEKRIDISIYSNYLYMAPQMREIRLGLEERLDVSSYAKLRFSAMDMKTKRLALKEKAAQTKQASDPSTSAMDFSELEQLIEENPYAEQEKPFKIVLSPDGMEAYLSMSDPDNKPTEDEVLKEVWNCKIRKGILRAEIKKATDGTYEEDTVLIAVGKNAINGKDGWYEYFFHTEINKKPKLNEDGSVNYKDIEWYDAVKKGDKIAYYHKAEDGTDGYDVEGNVLKSVRGHELSALSGNGFVLDRDKCTYYAKTDGMVRLNGENLEVNEMLEVDEINASIGNIVFDGSIHVKGDVGENVLIKAGKDILIDGFVEAAQLEAEGDIVLRRGMNGDEKGKIKAKGNVTAKFLESANVYSGGYINIDYSMNSILYAEKTVEAKLRTGSIAGGTCTGVKGVNAMNIGTKASVRTVIKTGISEALLQINSDTYKEYTAAKEELRILVNMRSELEGKFSAAQLSSQPVYEKVQNSIFSKSKLAEKLGAQLEEVKAQLMEIERATVCAKGTIYDGVRIQIGNASWYPTKELSDVTLRKVRKGSDEKVFAFHNGKDVKDPDAIVQ